MNNSSIHAPHRFSRRRFTGIVGMAAATAALQPTRYFTPSAAAQDIHIVDEKTKQVVETVGETNMQVYVPATGHTMSSVLLDYWRVTGRDLFFGNPISEPFETEAGVYSQIMEKGMIQYVPELMFTLEPFVRFGPNGRAMLQQQAAGFRSDGRRAGGGGNPRAGAWAMPKGTQLDGWVGAYGDFGADVAEPFADWYWTKEGRFYLGFPLSGLVNDGGRYGQWFEGGFLIEGENGPELAPLGPVIASLLGVDTTPVDQGGMPADDENLFLTVPNPYPTEWDPAAPGAKHLYVNLNQQRIDAYEGEHVVLSAPVSTGLWPNKTEYGNFRVRNKKQFEDMRGATDANGKVLWVVGDGGNPPAGSIPYGVSDVPNVLYINLQAEALHGAYWHNEFGQTRSHGCINLPLDVAKYLYDWAPLGTPVDVYLEEGKVYPGSENATPEELKQAEEDSKKSGGV
jgi:hypothetical protein